MYIDSNNLYYLIMRIESLDILKGIGIILVVVGHMIGNQLYIRPWIYAFHMPHFFHAIGILLQYSEASSIATVCCK